MLCIVRVIADELGQLVGVRRTRNRMYTWETRADQAFTKLNMLDNVPIFPSSSELERDGRPFHL
jgi:hypothetical protein